MTAPSTQSHSARPSDPDRVPARVHDYSVHGLKLAAVTHPAGPSHENAKRAINRLLARGYTIVPARVAALSPCATDEDGTAEGDTC